MTDSNQPITLDIEHLAKSYNKRQVVKDITFSIKSGEIVGLLGPNGAGKTTSFYMVAGLVDVDAGSILLNGEEISHLAMHKRSQKGIGYLPQEASIFRKLSISDNIMSILEMRKDLNKQQRIDKLNALIAEFRLDHIRDSLGMSVSGGERRRCEIARALAANPTFILLDEPFAGVDPISVNDIKIIIEDLKNRGIGVLITDHNVRETLAICEKAFIVSQGSIIASGTAEEILANELVKKVYLGEDFKA